MQRNFNYTQSINGKPEDIFPLLCPVREKDWLDGWEYEMIHSSSGLVEDNCVFKTPGPGSEGTYWMVSHYDPSQFRIEFVRFSPGEVIVKITIVVEPKQDNTSEVDISYIYSPLSVEQKKYVEEQLPVDFINSMQWWEQAMNHYLKTGEMLRH